MSRGRIEGQSAAEQSLAREVRTGKKEDFFSVKREEEGGEPPATFHSFPSSSSSPAIVVVGLIFALSVGSCLLFFLFFRLRL